MFMIRKEILALMKIKAKMWASIPPLRRKRDRLDHQ